MNNFNLSVESIKDKFNTSFHNYKNLLESDISDDDKVVIYNQMLAIANLEEQIGLGLNLLNNVPTMAQVFKTDNSFIE